jgi:hypothetical protein
MEGGQWQGFHHGRRYGSEASALIRAEFDLNKVLNKRRRFEQCPGGDEPWRTLMSKRRLQRVPDFLAERRDVEPAWKRGRLYDEAKKHPELIVKWGRTSFVDAAVADRIERELPPLHVTVVTVQMESPNSHHPPASPQQSWRATRRPALIDQSEL